MRELRSLPAGARVLEVGSGDGRFLERMAARGWKPVGIEPSVKDSRAPGPLEPSPVLSTTVEEARFESASFDAVVLWHSLEHLGDPSEALGRIHEWLSPGGLVVIGVPNLVSLQARLGGDRWFHQDLPRHRTHFSPAGLRALLGRTGFEPLRERHLIVEQNALGMWQTLLNRLTGERNVLFRMTKGDRSLSRRDRLVTALVGVPLAPIALLAELLAGLGRRGGSIAVVARRLP